MPSVAVIGLGAFGLCAVKNLLEEDFEVTGFDQNAYLGGLWHHTSSPSTVSVLSSTIANSSKERGCFTDFPFKDGVSSFPTAAEVDQYLVDYTEHFNLGPHLKLNTRVINISRDNSGRTWIIETQVGSNSSSYAFDKVVVATGQYQIPKIPRLNGQERFKGEVLHSANFKEPLAFKGRRVMVVGIGNSAADTATALSNIASTIYLAHRGGCLLLPRHLKDGTSLDHDTSYRKFVFNDILEYISPKLAEQFANSYLQGLQKRSWTLRPEWKLTPAPSLAHMLPVISDKLVEELSCGNVNSVAAPKAVIGDFTIELEDGGITEIDALIYCTGYNVQYSFLGSHDPTLLRSSSTAPQNLSNQRNYDTPRLFRNIFSLEDPEDLAIMGTAMTYLPAFTAADLSSMAIAQLWKHPERFPSRTLMQQKYDEHVRWTRSIQKTGRYISNQVQYGSWMKWVEEATGTNLSKNLGYGVQGWKFWWQDRAFCNQVMDGLTSPHVYRLFPSDRRKVWPEAKAAIQKVNHDIKERLGNRPLTQATSYNL